MQNPLKINQQVRNISHTLPCGTCIELYSDFPEAIHRATSLAQRRRFAVALEGNQVASYIGGTGCLDVICLAFRALTHLDDDIRSAFQDKLRSASVNTLTAEPRDKILMVILRQHLRLGLLSIRAVQKLYASCANRKLELLILVAELFQKELLVQRAVHVGAIDKKALTKLSLTGLRGCSNDIDSGQVQFRAELISWNLKVNAGESMKFKKRYALVLKKGGKLE